MVEMRTEKVTDSVSSDKAEVGGGGGRGRGAAAGLVWTCRDELGVLASHDSKSSLSPAYVFNPQKPPLAMHVMYEK